MNKQEEDLVKKNKEKIDKLNQASKSLMEEVERRFGQSKPKKISAEEKEQVNEIMKNFKLLYNINDLSKVRSYLMGMKDELSRKNR